MVLIIKFSNLLPHGASDAGGLDEFKNAIKEIQKRKSLQALLKTKPLILKVPESQTGMLFGEVRIRVAPCLFSFSRLSLLANITQFPGVDGTLVLLSIPIHIFLCITRVIFLNVSCEGTRFQEFGFALL